MAFDDKYYDNLREKQRQFIEFNKPKALHFLQNIPFDEFTATLKSKLGIDNLDIKYTIREDDRNNIFGYYLRYQSNNLADESKLLGAMFQDYRIETFGFEKVCAYLQDGRRYNSDILKDELDTFDVEQPLEFYLSVWIEARYKGKNGGENGIDFGTAHYSEGGGWEFNW